MVENAADRVVLVLRHFQALNLGMGRVQSLAAHRSIYSGRRVLEDKWVSLGVCVRVFVTTTVEPRGMQRSSPSARGSPCSQKVFSGFEMNCELKAPVEREVFHGRAGLSTDTAFKVKPGPSGSNWRAVHNLRAAGKFFGFFWSVSSEYFFSCQHR